MSFTFPHIFLFLHWSENPQVDPNLFLFRRNPSLQALFEVTPSEEDREPNVVQESRLLRLQSTVPFRLYEVSSSSGRFRRIIQLLPLLGISNILTVALMPDSWNPFNHNPTFSQQSLAIIQGLSNFNAGGTH
jgi:hypothetical protein